MAKENGSGLHGVSTSAVKPDVFHPRRNDKGELVKINHPSIPSPLSAFDDPRQTAIVVPNGQLPVSLNGIAFQAWEPAPASLDDWANVAGQIVIKEPPLKKISGKALSAGVVIFEPDNRVWLVAPTNAFGSYITTFPKGRIEPGLSAQATAIKEVYEESGLQVEITGLIGDFERKTTVTRYYTGRRVGGMPALMGWETQAVMLVPKNQLLKVLNHTNDHVIVQSLVELKFC